MRATVVVLMVTVGLAGCGDGGGSDPVIALGRDAYAPVLDADAFVATIDNPYLPLLPGTTWVYEGESDGEHERVEVVVTDERKRIMGIDAVVVRDTVRIGGEVVEDTRDWFAQDADGNVWYLGEDSRDYENGEVVSTEGSWEAGVDGARAGIVMPAAPAVGLAYEQEHYEGEAEDRAEIVRVGKARVVTREWNPLEPDVVEEKHYERGVGLVLEVVTEGGEGRVELVSHERASTA